MVGRASESTIELVALLQMIWTEDAFSNKRLGSAFAPAVASQAIKKSMIRVFAALPRLQRHVMRLAGDLGSTARFATDFGCAVRPSKEDE